MSAGSSIASGYQVYPGMPSHVLSLKSRSGNSAFFINDDIRLDILNRNALTLMQPDPEQFNGNKNVIYKRPQGVLCDIYRSAARG